MAATTGHADLVDYLVEHGAPPPGLDPAVELLEPLTTEGTDDTNGP